MNILFVALLLSGGTYDIGYDVHLAHYKEKYNVDSLTYTYTNKIEITYLHQFLNELNYDDLISCLEVRGLEQVSVSPIRTDEPNQIKFIHRNVHYSRCLKPENDFPLLYDANVVIAGNLIYFEDNAVFPDYLGYPKSAMDDDLAIHQIGRLPSPLVVVNDGREYNLPSNMIPSMLLPLHDNSNFTKFSQIDTIMPILRGYTSYGFPYVLPISFVSFTMCREDAEADFTLYNGQTPVLQVSLNKTKTVHWITNMEEPAHLAVDSLITQRVDATPDCMLQFGIKAHQKSVTLYSMERLTKYQIAGVYYSGPVYIPPGIKEGSYWKVTVDIDYIGTPVILWDV